MLAYLACRFNTQQLDHLFALVEKSWGGSEQNMARLLHLVQQLAEEDADGNMASKVMELVWSLAHSQDTSSITVEAAITAMFKILQGRSFHENNTDILESWLCRCIAELRQVTWIVPAMRMMQSLLELLSRESLEMHPKSDSPLQKLINDGLVTVLLGCWESYIGMLQQLKQSTDMINAPGVDEIIVFEKWTHKETSQQFLRLLRFITTERDMYPTPDETIRLWEALVTHSPTSEDFERGLKWFHQAFTSNQDIPVNIQEKLLRTKLLEMNLETMPLMAVKCVQAIFFNVNVEANNFCRSAGSLHIVNPDNILFLEFLWDIAVTLRNETHATVVMKTLNDIFSTCANSCGTPDNINRNCIDKIIGTWSSKVCFFFSLL